MLHPQVVNLLNRPQMIQRTEEWFLARKTRITASEVGSILGVNPYKNRNKYWIEKKCQLENIPIERKGTFTTEHGLKYEPVIQQMIREKYKTIYVDDEGKPKDPLYEFGLIPHPTISFLGASPDGILFNGKMVEIKCVVSRDIIENEVVPYYYAQVQTQLECCGLDECEFTECKIIEYKGMNEFILDSKSDNNIWRTAILDKRKGIVLQDNMNNYIYIDDMTIDNKILPNNEKELREFLNKYLYKNIYYWYCNQFSVKNITKNVQYIERMVEICGKFWDTLKKPLDKVCRTENDVKDCVPNMIELHKPFYFENMIVDNCLVKNTKKRTLDENLSEFNKDKNFLFRIV